MKAKNYTVKVTLTEKQLEAIHPYLEFMFGQSLRDVPDEAFEFAIMEMVDRMINARFPRKENNGEGAPVA